MPHFPEACGICTLPFSGFEEREAEGGIERFIYTSQHHLGRLSSVDSSGLKLPSLLSRVGFE